MTTAVSVQIHDETSTGERTRTFSLDFLTAEITVAELIHKRVFEEVAEYNRTQPECFAGLVQPTDAERTRNGFRLRERRTLDAEAQALRALDAFMRNGFILIVDDRQVETLNEVVALRFDTEISFIKLLPLVGG